MLLVSVMFWGGQRTDGEMLFSLLINGLYLNLHLCLFKSFLILKGMRQLLHSFSSFLESSTFSESVSDEEKSELCGVRVRLGE